MQATVQLEGPMPLEQLDQSNEFERTLIDVGSSLTYSQAECAVPIAARRAASIEPMEALRTE